MATVEFPEVKDRNVATPSRVRLTKAVGIEDNEVFDVEPVPGSIYEEGTPLNKEFFDALKNYIDNNVGSPDNPIPVTNGGTGASTAEGARTNLEVYSKTEIDEQFKRTSNLIEPHIASRVTDAPEGIHGFYIDAEGRQWTDPDGDGQLQSNYPVDNETIGYSEDQSSNAKKLHIIDNSIGPDQIKNGYTLPNTSSENGLLFKMIASNTADWYKPFGTVLWQGRAQQGSITIDGLDSYNLLVFFVNYGSRYGAVIGVRIDPNESDIKRNFFGFGTSKTWSNGTFLRDGQQSNLFLAATINNDTITAGVGGYFCVGDNPSSANPEIYYITQVKGL